MRSAAILCQGCQLQLQQRDTLFFIPLFLNEIDATMKLTLALAMSLVAATSAFILEDELSDSSVKFQKCIVFRIMMRLMMARLPPVSWLSFVFARNTLVDSAMRTAAN